jgi:hypothetical protein
MRRQRRTDIEDVSDSRDRGYFRPQNTSLKPAVSTILIDIFGTREDLSRRADRCSRTKNDGCFFGIPDVAALS